MEDKSGFWNAGTRYWEYATLGIIVALAALLGYESLRLGAGWGSSGPETGFWPFWMTVMIGISAVFLLPGLLRREEFPPFWDSREGGISAMKVMVPLVALGLAVDYLGIYFASALYMGFFTRWLGNYRWPAVIAAAVVTPVALYLVFEKGFLLLLPKSPVYGANLPIIGVFPW